MGLRTEASAVLLDDADTIAPTRRDPHVVVVHLDVYRVLHEDLRPPEPIVINGTVAHADVVADNCVVADLVLDTLYSLSMQTLYSMMMLMLSLSVQGPRWSSWM